MIWLASFPRSGNTFLRNILYEVYGISSVDYQTPSKETLKPKYKKSLVIKTHLLPHQLPKDLQNAKSVYLIRDGRDAMVSFAYHRKNIVAPGSNYYFNLALSILFARERSFFGGWSKNVDAWTKKATIVIYYEDLIRNPIKEVERLRSIVDLPPPKIDKLPNFESLKNGTPKYGSGGKNLTIKDKQKFAQHFYRRGVSGTYKKDMPRFFQFLFWLRNRKMMKAHNYYKN